MSAKARAAGRYVCPDSPQPGICTECAAPFPHIREEWVQKGQKIPRCDHHDTRLIPA